MKKIVLSNGKVIYLNTKLEVLKAELYKAKEKESYWVSAVYTNTTEQNFGPFKDMNEAENFIINDLN